ncbi:MAG: ROK family protein [Lachnospiraceae bacterium]|jgi:predicted NBD/HSP70 family sugar kinase|nr:ROK family protein [Lachnospiraceae bacterium]
MEYYLCFDIGGTSIKYGIWEPERGFLMTDEKPTPAKKGGSEIVSVMKKTGDELVKLYPVAGICISTAGMVDCEKGIITYASPLISDYAGTRLKEEMESYFQLPCEVENDVNCAGLAECHAGVACGYSSALCVTVGTGIGAAILLDGKVLHGACGNAGEVGYMHLPGGALQDIAAASVLVSEVESAMGLPHGSIDGKWVFDHADTGDIICLSAIEKMADILSMGIANICYVLNPQIVVLGGGILAREERLLPLVHRGLKKYLISAIAENTRVKAARNGNRAGMIGAWFHFRERRF